MDNFTRLYLELDSSNRTSDKLDSLADYFRSAAPEDAIWAVYLLAGRKIGRTISSTQMRTWAAEVSGYPEWLVRECYSVVGDLSETLSLLIPFERSSERSIPLHEMIEDRLRPLGKMSAEHQKAMMIQTWRELSSPERFILHKLISGNFRVGVSRQSLVLALAQASGVPAASPPPPAPPPWCAHAPRTPVTAHASTATNRIETS